MQFDAALSATTVDCSIAMLIGPPQDHSIIELIETCHVHQITPEPSLTSHIIFVKSAIMSHF